VCVLRRSTGCKHIAVGSAPGEEGSRAGDHLRLEALDVHLDHPWAPGDHRQHKCTKFK